MFTTEVKLRFDFFKKKFTYQFIGLTNLLDQLGGAGSVAGGFLKKFSTIFLIIFII